jgi:hypothetical protein
MHQAGLVLDLLLALLHAARCLRHRDIPEINAYWSFLVGADMYDHDKDTCSSTGEDAD